MCLSVNSYIWANVLAYDAYEAFHEAIKSNDSEQIEAVGKRFRDTVLSLGGGHHPLEVFKQFRGREPSIEPLLRQYNVLVPQH